MKERAKLIKKMWDANPEIYGILCNSKDLDEARSLIHRFIDGLQKRIRTSRFWVHPLEWTIVRECAGTLKNIISVRCEEMAKESSLRYLYMLAQNPDSDECKTFSIAFIEDMRRIFKGLTGRSGIYYQSDEPEFAELKGREAAIERCKTLNNISDNVEKWISKYKGGLDEGVIKTRIKNKEKTLKYFGGTDKDWGD